MKIGDTEFHKRLTDFHAFDRITFHIVPRYKESGLSGDEWRQHVEVEFHFKGEVVHSERFRDMETALMMTPAAWINAQEPMPGRVIALEQERCDQPSCTATATVRYRLKEEFSRSGEKLDASDIHFRKYRQFCDRHKTRGDCGREDSDLNYERVEQAA
jgi:hypothetical protein